MQLPTFSGLGFSRLQRFSSFDIFQALSCHDLRSLLCGHRPLFRGGDGDGAMSRSMPQNATSTSPQIAGTRMLESQDLFYSPKPRGFYFPGTNDSPCIGANQHRITNHTLQQPLQMQKLCCINLSFDSTAIVDMPSIKERLQMLLRPTATQMLHK
jgi:hypothetical protein